MSFIDNTPKPLAKSTDFLLLQSVLPFFLEVLPKPNENVEDTRSARKKADALQDMRTEMEQVTDAFTIKISRLLELDKPEYDAFDFRLTELLSVLEDILAKFGAEHIEKVTNTSRKTFPKYPSLTQLEWDTKQAGFDLLEKTKGFAALFSLDIKLYRNLTMRARSFNTTAKLMHNLMVEPDKTQSPDRELPSWFNPAKVYVDEVSQATRFVLDDLRGLLCTEHKTHQGYLRLDSRNLSQVETLRPDPSDIFMLLPHGNDDAEKQWLPTVFHYTAKAQADQALGQDTLCPAIDTAMTMELPAITIDVHPSGYYMALRETDITETGNRAGRGPVKTPTQTLNDVFNHEQAVRSGQTGLASRYYDIAYNIKRRLAAEIATAALYLATSELFNVGKLHMDTLLVPDWDSGPISTTETSVELYLNFQVEEETLPASPPKFQLLAGDIAVGTPCFLALALIIMQLEMDELVVLQERDINPKNKELSWHAAAVRCSRALADRAGDKIRGIVNKCLWLSLEVNMLPGDLLDKLFLEVVVPLTVWSNGYSYKGLKRQGAYIEVPSPKRVKTSSPAEVLPPYVPPLAPPITLNPWPGALSIRSLPFATPRTNPADVYEFGTTEEMEEAGDTTSEIMDRLEPESIQSPSDWMGAIDDINYIMEMFIKTSKVSEPEEIRVAILDTGCDPYFPGKVRNIDARLKNRWHDLAGSSTDPVDEDEGQHGSAVSTLLMEVAPHVATYVIRVAKDPASLDPRNVAEAIKHAVGEWDVHIISMSFGFTNIKSEVTRAIREANLTRERIIFAAAGNEGQNEPERFPASDPAVISVGGTDHRGGFIYKPQKPVFKSPLIYGTLAKVSFGDEERSGSSYATPIMAGILATVMQYACYISDTGLRKALERKDFVDGLLYEISTSSWEGDNSTLRYLEPFTFFKRSKQARATKLLYVLHELPKMD